MIPGARTIVRRAASFSSRDSVSGYRIPAYTESNITGLLVERGGDMPALEAGVLMTQDAVLYTEDTVAALDQIRDGTKYFQVAEIEEKKDVDGVLVYRACHLRRIELYVEAGS